MRRADRLLDLVARLKAKPLVRGEDLAAAMETSVRTIYRDIAVLQARGLPIEGQAGVGYMLRGAVDLPPLVFDHDQLEALALGLAYVEQVGDGERAPRSMPPGRMSRRRRPRSGACARGKWWNIGRRRSPPCCARRCGRAGSSRSTIVTHYARKRGAKSGLWRSPPFRAAGC